MKKWIPLAAVALLLGSGALVAQSFIIPQVQSVQSGDLFPDVVGGQPTANTYYASGAQMGVLGAQQSGGNFDNALIGGDFSTNLFQRGTSVSLASATYYVAYGADRWFTWGGTSTPATMTQQTGAADLPAGTSASYRINKGSLTGVLQICTSQVVESANVYRFQGQTAEFTFDALAGSGFSAASSNLAVYVSYGTGVDDGAVKMAYGLNAHGGAGTTSWTGQANLGGTNGFLIPITSSWNRYGVAVPIPLTATELGVSICYTPVGTGTATDWFEFGKAQLVINPALTTLAGTAGAAINATGTAGGSAAAPVKSFNRRPSALETLLQQRYFYQLTETAAIIPIATCAVSTTSLGNCFIAFPTTMRTTPTAGSYTAGWGMTVGAQTSVVACTANATVTSVTSTALSPQMAPVTCTSSAGFGAAGTVAWLYGGQGSHTGVMSFSAEE
jgi:hypothetical protein